MRATRQLIGAALGVCLTSPGAALAAGPVRTSSHAPSQTSSSALSKEDLELSKYLHVIEDLELLGELQMIEILPLLEVPHE